MMYRTTISLSVCGCDGVVVRLMCVDLHTTARLHLENAPISVSPPPPLPTSSMPRLDSTRLARLHSGSLFGGSGGVAPERWGIAKMAAASKGMKTVTSSYQSFQSVPCPCWAFAVYTLTRGSHSFTIRCNAPTPKCWSGHMSIMIYIIDVRRSPLSHKKVIYVDSYFKHVTW